MGLCSYGSVASHDQELFSSLSNAGEGQGWSNIQHRSPVEAEHKNTKMDHFWGAARAQGMQYTLGIWEGIGEP